MPHLTLTDRFLAGALTPGEYVDLALPNFGVRVGREGRIRYFVRVREQGRRVRVRLGLYPDVTLAAARVQARALLHAHDRGHALVAPKLMRATLARGGAVAPAVAARGMTVPAAALTPMTLTFARLRDDFIEAHRTTWSPYHLSNQEFFANRLCGPIWDGRLARELTRQEIRLFIRDYAKQAPVNANRLQAFLSRLFRWAVEEDLLDAAPTLGLRKPTQESRRERVLRAEELQRFWQACLNVYPDERSSPRARAFADIWRLRLLTAQREQELRRLEWRFIDWTEGYVVFPARLMKNRHAHVVPLVGRARQILERRRAQASQFDRFVFGTRKATAHAPARTRGVPVALPDFRGHDLRRTATTLMTRHGVTRFVVARVLGHTDKTVTAIYDQYEYLPEKRAALETLDRVLGAILTPDAQQPAAAVVPFARL